MPAESTEVRKVDPADRVPAMGVLMLGIESVSDEQGERLMQFADQLGVGFDHLWAGYPPDGRVGPVALVVPRPGRTGMLFVSRPRKRRDEAVLAEVIGRAIGGVKPAEVALVQALIAPGDDGEQRALTAAGLERLATLEYMQRAAPTGQLVAPLPQGVALRPYRHDRRGRFIEALDASYQATRDCPALQGLRDTEDVLDGHMAAGTFREDLWSLVEVDGRAAGVMLLNPIPAQRCLELVYFGLAPFARGRGIGRALMHRALKVASSTALPTMTLAVDQDNASAMHLYQSAGFYRVGRKHAFIKPLISAGG